MQTPINGARLARITGIVLVIALTPLATLAQRAAERAGPPRAVTEFANGREVITARVGAALNNAITALNAERFDEARAAVGELSLDRLTPYERGKLEQVLFNVAYAERAFGEARQHLVNAIESGGLNPDEIAQAQDVIRQIDARLATAPAA